MSWAKLDDRFHENRKVRGLWRRHPAALGLHVLALTYCAGHETDGLVDLEFVEDKVPSAATRRRLTDALVDAGMWVPEGEAWRIHDYLDYHPSRQTLEGKRAKDADRKARGRDTQARDRADSGDPWSDVPHRVHSVSARTDDGLHAESSGPVPTRPDPSKEQPRPAETAEPVATDLDRARERLRAEHVQRVFDAWLAARSEHAGRQSTAILDDKRRRLIRRALTTHPLEDVLAAVVGWRNSPHHRGENDTSTVYADLGLLLRSAEHIERFRDLAAGPTPPPTGARGHSDSDGDLEAWAGR